MSQDIVRQFRSTSRISSHLSHICKCIICGRSLGFIEVDREERKTLGMVYHTQLPPTGPILIVYVVKQILSIEELNPIFFILEDEQKEDE